MTERDHEANETSSPTTSNENDIESTDSYEHPDIAEVPTHGALEKLSTASSGFQQQAQSALSTIRSREPGQTARFTHPLSHTKTSEDVIVDFDGPDDPYRPINWGFKKKAVTTVLYGLTTMGRLGFEILERTVLTGWEYRRDVG